MNNRFKIWHLLILILILILFLRYSFIYELLILLFYYFALINNNAGLMASQLSINLIDNFTSLFIITGVPLVLFWKRNKLKFLFYEAGFTNSVLTVLIVFTFLAPIAAPSQFDFQYNISVSKLSNPLSEKKIVYLKKEANYKNAIDRFIDQRDFVFNKGMIGDYIIADSINKSGDLIIFQKEKKQVINEEFLNKEKITPEISSVYFLLGTDEYGRDILSRLIYGTRLSLFVGFGSVLISFTVGIMLGFTAGYLGGFADTLLNRLSDIFLSFPFIFLIILIVGLFGNSVISVVSVLGFAGWMNLFKIVRNETASLKKKDFIITTKLLGFSNYHILFKEMLPIMMPSIVVTIVLQYGSVIIAESALSYLGLGLGNNFPSWGAMIEAGQYYLSSAWWMSFFPCLFLFLTLYAANHFGSKLESILKLR